MEIDLIYDQAYSRSTGWTLGINGLFQCFALGLPLEFEGVANVPNKTCCPYGRFEAHLRFSPHNACEVIELIDVPDRQNIEIHIGNFPENILGCWCVGLKRNDNAVISSTAAFNDLMAKAQKAVNAGEKIFVNVAKAQETS